MIMWATILFIYITLGVWILSLAYSIILKIDNNYKKITDEILELKKEISEYNFNLEALKEILTSNLKEETNTLNEILKKIKKY